MSERVTDYGLQEAIGDITECKLQAGEQLAEAVAFITFSMLPLPPRQTDDPNGIVAADVRIVAYGLGGATAEAWAELLESYARRLRNEVQ